VNGERKTKKILLLKRFGEIAKPLLLGRRYITGPDMCTSQEEINEISLGVGLEYRFHRIIAIRGGYFHEHETKGSRKYYTVGLGFHYKYVSLDGSWLIPAKSGNPLKDTYRLTLSLDFPAIS